MNSHEQKGHGKIKALFGELKIIKSSWLIASFSESEKTGFLNYSFLEFGPKAELFRGASDSGRSCSS